MTEVDFYILSESAAEQRTRFACRLADKAFRKGHDVHLHVDDEDRAAQLDELLWSFRPDSFLPHGPPGGPDGERVTIGWGGDPGERKDVMINLALAVPDFVGRFERVAEVVVQDAEIRDSLRRSYKFYRDRGYPVRNNKL